MVLTLNCHWVGANAAPSMCVPAFSATSMYTIQGGNLVAVAASGSPNRWTFRNGNLVTARWPGDADRYAERLLEVMEETTAKRPLTAAVR